MSPVGKRQENKLDSVPSFHAPFQSVQGQSMAPPSTPPPSIPAALPSSPVDMFRIPLLRTPKLGRPRQYPRRRLDFSVPVSVKVLGVQQRPLESLSQANTLQDSRSVRQMPPNRSTFVNLPGSQDVMQRHSDPDPPYFEYRQVHSYCKVSRV